MSINKFSPNFRDILLNKNIVADTISNNGLLAELIGIGYPAKTDTTPIAVQPSPDIVSDGVFYKDQNVINNEYLGGPTDYTLVSIQNLNTNVTTQTGPYTNDNDLLNSKFVDNNGNSVTSDDIRKQTTIKNIYVDTDKQLTINLNTNPVPTYQNLTSYIDENNNLSIGGPSTQAADIIGGILNGQGVGLNFNNGSIGAVANSDIRASLLGRVLGATGAINDTPLGIIGGKQLLAHVGYNSAFGLQQETLGALNLNPLTLLQGKPLINLNYQITTPVGVIGKVLNFTSNVLGVQSPISLLQTSIFTFSNKLDYIGMGNIQRANLMLKNSGNGQVKQLIDHMNANLKVPKIDDQVSLRQGYSPNYTDGRRSVGENTEDGVNYRLYARGDGDGFIVDFLNGKTNSPITSGNYERSKQISDDGWDLGTSGLEKNSNPSAFNHTSRKDGGVLYKDAFGWQDSNFNKDIKEGIGISTDRTLFIGSTDGKNRAKTLLSKTEKLFNSGNMKTLISGHGVKEEGKSQINSAVSSVGNLTSKGSGVMSADAIKGNNSAIKPENVFCRTWTTYDRYAQVLDLQKNKGVNGSYGTINNKTIYRNNAEKSVLDSNGFVKVAPYSNVEKDVKKYMFSIENLAWAGETTNLLPCEIGPGDPMNPNLKGRIMWFPPYDISFSETTSANWDKHNFIGRGEPMYTYNNTERTGTLSWKLIIDHPNYLNLLKLNEDTSTNDYLASFFAGCMPLEGVLTQEESDKTNVNNAQKPDVRTVVANVPPPSFNVYFPNDVYKLEGEYETYEDGKCKNGPITCYINRKTNLEGNDEGLGTYNEMCYKYKANGIETWSSVECSKNNPPGLEGSSTGRIEPDRTDFGLNGSGTTSDYKNVMIGDIKYINFKDPNYKKDLNAYLNEKCPNCKIEVVGFASTAGGGEKNKKLSELRANWVKDYIQNNILDEEFKSKINVKSEGAGETQQSGSGGNSVCPKLTNAEEIERAKGNYLVSKNDNFGCKVQRYVTVKFVDDANNSPLADNIKTLPEVTVRPRRPAIPISRLLTECDYFEILKDTDKVVYDSISEKIKYFQPAFHSTTPEGFNARLTFLQQCMRQGKTKGVIDDSNPSNLAFGRPPVCILRIGDFFHTKIIIDNISFDYEPLVWDLNPEGVGVQPMICNVTMSFAFIGGSSLNGPISKLQNALSFNYYANTEMYDSRSDYIKINGNSAELVPGNTNINPDSDANILPVAAKQEGIGTNITPETNQVAQNENANAATTPNAENTQALLEPDDEIFTNAIKNGITLNIKNENSSLVGSFSLNNSSGILSKDYNAKIQVATNGGDLDIDIFKINGKNSNTPNFGEFKSKKDDWKEILLFAANNETNVVFKIFIEKYAITYKVLKNINDI